MALQIKLLDTLQIDRDGQPSPVRHSPRGLALLLHLLISRKSLSRETLADLLWDDYPTAQALRNLRALLFRLRRYIPQIKIDGERLAFEVDPADEIDLFALLENLDSTQPDRLAAALQIYQSDLLRDFYLPDAARFNEWLTIEREHLRRRVLAAYQRLCGLYQEQGDWPAGAAAAQRWLELDPFDEEAHYHRMNFLAASGQPRLALEQYQRYCQMLADQFELEPAPKIRALFENLRAATTDREQPTTRSVLPSSYKPDWGTAPKAATFFGRETELAQIEDWLLIDHYPVVTILGIGGQGKTTLAAQAARSLADRFDGVIWRSLLNAPLPGELLRELLAYFSAEELPDDSASFDQQLAALRQHLKRQRFLVVLDNLESVLAENADQYRREYGGYERILRVFTHGAHRSSLLITTRENPHGLTRLTQADTSVQSLPLAGLPATTGCELLEHAGLSESVETLAQLVDRYSGNPLALKLVGRTVEDFYGGDVTAFLQDDTAIFEDIRAVLDQQFERLNSLEQDILIWLAIEREPVTLTELQHKLLHPPRQRQLLEAIYRLQRRSLLEKLPQGFGLQNVIIEYLTDRLVERISRELIRGHGHYLNRFALQPAHDCEYVRLSQARRILQPILDNVSKELPPGRIISRIEALLDHLRALAPRQQGYAAGNLLNLILQLGLDPARFDFSRLTIWHVNLQGVDLPAVNFAGSDLTDSIFNDLFGMVYAVAYNPIGQLLAAGTADGRLQLWWTATGQPALTIQAHAQSIWGIAFSPDGQTLASCSADGTVRLWQTANGAPGKILKGHPEGVLAVAFSPDGTSLVSAGEAGQICLWDAPSGELRHVLKAHSAHIQAIAFSPDGAWLASGGRDRLIHLWSIDQLPDRDTLTPDRTLRSHTNWVNALAFSSDGHTLASAGDGALINLWNIEHGELLQTLRGHTAGIHALAFSPAGNLLASGSNDHSVRLWDVYTGQLRHTFFGHTNWVYSLAFSPDGHTLASGSWDYSVRLWDVYKRQALQTYHGHMKWVFGLAFSADGHTLASASADRKVRLWDVAGGTIKRTLAGHTDWVWNVEFTPDMAVLASISMDHTIRLWHTQSGELLAVLREHHDGVQSLAISLDGRLLASGGLDHTIILWDIGDVAHGRQPRLLRKLIGHTGWCLGLDFSPDGMTLASSDADHMIRLWNTATGECTRIFDEHVSGVQQVRFSPDGRLLASASWDKTVNVRDVVSGEIIQHLTGHTNILRALAFSPDGRLLATGGNDQTIRVWNAASGELCREIPAHENWIFYLSFSPDGRTLASASGDETIKLWDVASGELRQAWRIPGPYEGLNLSAATGLSQAQLANLTALGAIQDS